jgi:hypothetical protein
MRVDISIGRMRKMKSTWQATKGRREIAEKAVNLTGEGIVPGNLRMAPWLGIKSSTDPIGGQTLKNCGDCDHFPLKARLLTAFYQLLVKLGNCCRSIIDSFQT